MKNLWIGGALLTVALSVVGCSNRPRRAFVMPTPSPIYSLMVSNTCSEVEKQRQLTPKREKELLKKVNDKGRLINRLLRSDAGLKTAKISIEARTDLNCQNPRMTETFVIITGAYAPSDGQQQKSVVDNIARTHSDSQIPVYNHIGQTRR